MLKHAALKEVFAEVAHKFLWSNFEYSHIHKRPVPETEEKLFHSSVTIMPPENS